MADEANMGPRTSVSDGMPVDRPVMLPEPKGVMHRERDFQGFASGRGFGEGFGGDREVGKAKGDRIAQHSAPIEFAEVRVYTNLRGGNR